MLLHLIFKNVVLKYKKALTDLTKENKVKI